MAEKKGEEEEKTLKVIFWLLNKFTFWISTPMREFNLLILHNYIL